MSPLIVIDIFLRHSFLVGVKFSIFQSVWFRNWKIGRPFFWPLIYNYLCFLLQVRFLVVYLTKIQELMNVLNDPLSCSEIVIWMNNYYFNQKLRAENEYFGSNFMNIFVFSIQCAPPPRASLQSILLCKWLLHSGQQKSQYFFLI